MWWREWRVRRLAAFASACVGCDSASRGSAWRIFGCACWLGFGWFGWFWLVLLVLGWFCWFWVGLVRFGLVGLRWCAPRAALYVLAPLARCCLWPSCVVHAPGLGAAGAAPRHWVLSTRELGACLCWRLALARVRLFVVASSRVHRAVWSRLGAMECPGDGPWCVLGL